MVVFGPDSMDISYISIGKIIVKGVANHASKEYGFSHFLSYSALVQSQQPFEREGKNSLSSPFADYDILSKISILEDEEQDQHDHDIDIVPQYDLDPDPTLIPNQKPKWDENIIEAAGNHVGDPDDRRKMRSQCKNEYVAFSHTASLTTE